MAKNEQVDVVHNEAEHRFEAQVEGQLAEAEYRRSDGTVTFTRTEVPSELEGRGIGSALARAGLDWARREGLRVVPQCPFIRGYIERHPQYRDLLNGRSGGYG